MAAVHSGQRAHCGGRSDRQGYGGVACMQPSTVSRHEYPDCCEQEQSRLRWFANVSRRAGRSHVDRFQPVKWGAKRGFVEHAKGLT